MGMTFSGEDAFSVAMKFQMNKSLLHIALFAVVGLLLLACNPDEPTIYKRYTPNYFPIQEGAVKIFKVDSVDFTSFDNNISQYWIKEEVGGLVEGLDGEQYHLVVVFRKENWSDNWREIRHDFIRKDENKAVRYTENILFVNQRFPVDTHLRWNAAPYNDLRLVYGQGIDFDEAYYKQPHIYKFDADRSYDSVLTVVQHESYDLIWRYNFRELYAVDVGLYKKVALAVEFQLPDSLRAKPEIDTARDYMPWTGYRITQSLVDYRTPD